MDVFQAYTYGTAVWLSAQAAVFIAYPSYALSLLYTPDEDLVGSLSNAALYTSYTLATTLLLTALCTLLSLHLGATTAPDLTAPSTVKPPSILSAIFPLTCALHAATAVYSYTRYMHTGTWGSWASVAGSTALTVLGGGALLFGSESRAERGAGWPFKSEARREVSREKWRRREEKLKGGKGL